MQIEIVNVVTPDKYVLRGLWLGPKKPKRVLINIHGLNSNLFSGSKLFPLIDEETSVLTFNNRGSDIVSKVKHLNPNHPKGYDSIIAGTAHEVFEECVDDLEGAVQLCHDRGVKEVYLVGHSTGCQKSIFYLSKTKNKQNVSGVILLCPISDYTTISKEAENGLYNKALKFSEQAVKDGEPHLLIPTDMWPEELLDAQRFLSLYTAESSEEIFSYSQPEKDPKIFKSVSAPTLALFAEADEYVDRPAKKLQEWFDTNNNSDKYKSVVAPNALHNLKGSEEAVCKVIKGWISK